MAYIYSFFKKPGLIPVSIWSQGKDLETSESVSEFATSLQDTDPGLWIFVTRKTFEMIAEHRRAERKN